MKRQGCSLLILVAILMQGPLLFACLNPSFQKMSAAQPMACCANSCKQETTEETAKKACNRTKTTLNQKAGMTSVSNDALNSSVISNAVSSPKVSPSYPLLAFKWDQASPADPSVPLYILSHSLLI